MELFRVIWQEFSNHVALNSPTNVTLKVWKVLKQVIPEMSPWKDLESENYTPEDVN